jgi:hypothetical protein
MYPSPEPGPASTPLPLTTVPVGDMSQLQSIFAVAISIT